MPRKAILMLVVILSISTMIAWPQFQLFAAGSPSGSGKYMKHHYTYTQKDAATIAVFNPRLPRNDTVLIGAMLELIQKRYGKNQVKDLKPSLVPRNGKNLIKFKGVDYDYLFIIVKEATGEVNGMSMWREKH